MIDLDALAQESRRVGFELMGAAPVEPVGSGWYAPHVERMHAWLDEEHHADMAWLAERSGERAAPQLLLPGIASALVFWIAHRPPDLPRPADARGRVAAYAWGRDYHNVARKAVRKLRRWVMQHAPEVRMYISVDTGAVLERAHGERAGVGWIGKSSMLIHPRLGTFGSLAVMFLDATLPVAAGPHPDRCGTCSACIVACPTDAIRAPGIVDARRCISYWTIEHRGLIPRDVRPHIGEWAFGCDICQDVCPWNRHAPRADPARWRPLPQRAWPDLRLWLRTSSSALAASLEGSPMLRARPEGLKRNALIVLANVGCTDALPEIEAVLRADSDPVLRATAAWAALQLGSETAAAIAARDPHSSVRAEAAR